MTVYAISDWNYYDYEASRLLVIYSQRNLQWPMTVAGLSKAWTVARSNSGIMSSNPTQGIDVIVRLFCVCVVLWEGSGLATAWSLLQGVLPTVYRIEKLKKRPKSSKGL
jgi:hypothetical protein